MLSTNVNGNQKILNLPICLNWRAGVNVRVILSAEMAVMVSFSASQVL